MGWILRTIEEWINRLLFDDTKDSNEVIDVDNEDVE